MFRRSGSFSSYSVQGTMPSAGSETFCEALSKHRFNSIETAGSEQVSVGWVTPGDPTGASFDREDMDGDAAFWLRMRIDKKSLPRVWMSIYISSAERSRGRPMNRKERSELREDLEKKLLPRVLPSVALIDALYVPAKQRILLFATGAGVRDHFARLFHATFEATAIPMDPRALAHSLPLGSELHAQLDQVTPVKWVRGDGEPVTESAPADAADSSGETA